MKPTSSGLVLPLLVAVVAFLLIAFGLTYYTAHVAMNPAPVQAFESTRP